MEKEYNVKGLGKVKVSIQEDNIIQEEGITYKKYVTTIESDYAKVTHKFGDYIGEGADVSKAIDRFVGDALAYIRDECVEKEEEDTCEKAYTDLMALTNYDNVLYQNFLDFAYEETEGIDSFWK